MVGRKLVGKSNDWRELDETGKPAKTLSTRHGHSETLEIEENQGRTRISPCTVGAVRGCRGCPTEELKSSSCRHTQHGVALHCPADDGVVVRRVAPIPGDFSEHSCMAHGFENMRKPQMRPQLKTTVYLPSTPPRQPKPDDALVQSHQQEHGTFYCLEAMGTCCHQSLPSLATFRSSWPYDEYSPTKDTQTRLLDHKHDHKHAQHSTFAQTNPQLAGES
jgi:hypothetical protein